MVVAIAITLTIITNHNPDANRHKNFMACHVERLGKGVMNTKGTTFGIMGRLHFINHNQKFIPPNAGNMVTVANTA